MYFVDKVFKHKYLLFLFSFLLFGGIFLASSHVFAQADAFGVNTVKGFLPLGGEDIRLIAAKIIRIFLSLLGIIAIGLIMYAGFTWMTSGGNEEKIATAKKTLINATIGLVIIMSSFAITQFILGRLADATGAGGGDDVGAGRGPIMPCADFAACQDANRGPRECGDESFVVKSLTPRTPTNNGTGMSNTIIRAVFSRPLDAGQDLNQIFKLTRGDAAIGVKNVEVLAGRQIVEAYFSEDTALCVGDGNTRGCLSPGDYKIEINPELVAGGVKLQTKLACGVFDTTANFKVNQDFLDVADPVANSITFNGKNTREGQVVSQNARYRLNATFSDRLQDPQNVSFGGMSYLHLRVQSEPKDAAAEKVDWSYYTGPRSGSNEAFSLSQDLVFGANFPTPALYTLTFDVNDIDSNKTLATSTFILDGELCHNGVRDPGETGIDIGGKCLGDGLCAANWQCLSGECVNGQCMNRPIIRDVDVGGNDSSSWDSAPGSWVTIMGNFFGEDAGFVYFGNDANRDGNISEAAGEWVRAPLANCNGMDVWHDRTIIVEVPNIVPGTSTTIRVKTAAVGEAQSYEDLSTDDRGPKSGPNAGIFKVSNNDHPGLCSVLGPNNSNVASSTAPVTALGRALGGGANSALLFGGINSLVDRWTESTIRSFVPQNMSPGRVGVRAKVGNTFSNGVEFLVVGADVDLVPHIDSISPLVTSTLGSLLTLSGARFGENGTVYLATDKEAALSCATTDNNAIEAACARLDLLTLPDACGNTWSDNQIIGKIPSNIPFGRYYLVVKNNAVRNSDGNANTEFIAGPPLPGLCRINPNTGVAPLPNNATPLILTGINLSPNPRLYFWSLDALSLNSTDHLDPQGNNVIRRVAADGTSIETVLPVGRNGLSMSTGPIFARIGNELSNSVQYEVNDCTLGGDAPGPNYQCCKNDGPEKGLWKPQGLACSGETRSSGYVWRFTTGLIPQVPRVVEACNIEDWDDLEVDNFVRPSPSPWQNWGVGEACTDSIITVQFNMHMSPLNLENAVQVYTCGTGDRPDCQYRPEDNVTASYIPSLLLGQENILELRPRVADAAHIPGTWHRVILGNTLRANEAGLVEFGNNKINTSPLSVQRPLAAPVNGITAAYNFDFKTSNVRCSLFDAAITPPTYTTHLLGLLQDPGFPFSTNFDAPPHPFYYYVWGRGNQACSVIDVNGKGFEWHPQQNSADAMSNFAYATRSDKVDVPVTSTAYANSVRATVTALTNTLLEPVVITATTNTRVNNVDRQVTGRSNLFIQLGDPEATNWWPQCNDSCTNVRIGAQFNLPMVTSTYNIDGQSAIKIQECTGLGENCLDLVPENGLATSDVNSGAFDPFQYEVQVREPDALKINTLYQVTLSSQILSFAGTLNGATIFGKPLSPKVWKFRTKVKDGICILDKVDVVPSPFIANLVGQKTAYGASPLSSPDACSPTGQRLNPWAYGWNWSIENTDGSPVDANTKVADVTHFVTKGRPAAFCSGSCLPLGSDIPFGQTADFCGNGYIDPGEDCDVAAAGESPGVSCTLRCLRPGNLNSINTTTPFVAGKCGNGQAESTFGEECDLANLEQAAYCSNTCTWKGSSQEFSDEVSVLQCGNGKVGFDQSGRALLGEECDLGISLADAGQHPEWSAVGCSQNCLHLGTRMSRSYCEAPASNLTAEQRQSDACLDSITVCGDGNLGPGEECEMNPTDPTGLKIRQGQGILTLEVVSSTFHCSNRCILKNICEIKNSVGVNFSCDAGTPGCNADCTKAGSSGLYDQPSLCGDGDTGTGENSLCEPDALADATGFDEDPLQVVTAIGRGPVNPNTLMQETRITALATQVRRTSTSTESLRAKSITGKGNYALQCGYVEYPVPLVENGVTRFNNCPDINQGVAANSCCQARPTRIAEFPENGTGIGELDDTRKVCRNTLIHVDINHEVQEESVQSAVLIASLHPADYVCSSTNETNISLEVNSLLALSDDGAPPRGIFARVWENMKQFFVDIFNSVVHAAAAGNDFTALIARKGTVWCTGKVTPTVTLTPQIHADGSPTSTRMSMYINEALDPNTLYAVILRGGNGGITNINGVGIQGRAFQQNAQQFHNDDIFVFETGAQICRIQSVIVDPASQLFSAPNQSRVFQADVRSTTGFPIVSTPGYAWSWNWEPHINSIFTFPNLRNLNHVALSSKDLEGTLVASAQVTITNDITNVETNRVFAGLTSLTSLFCQNPWPSHLTYPYEDGVTFATIGRVNNDNFNLRTNRFDGRAIPRVMVGNTAQYFNFSFGYCADAGLGSDALDDLPLLRPVVQGDFPDVVGGTCSLSRKVCLNDAGCPGVRNGFAIQAQRCIPAVNAEDSSLPKGTLKKFLFFNNKNEDVIGLQVFANEKRLTARNWFISQGFSGIEKYQDVIVDGYDAITDGNNTYINALNELVDKRIYNHIYLIGVNANAQENTRQVLKKIMSKFTFNINISERNSCLLAPVGQADGGQYLPTDFGSLGVSPISCTTDFDCRDQLGVPTTTTNGICANGKSKFQRDWTRLTTIQTLENKIEDYRTAQSTYPILPAGTYIPGYTNTHWPSWSRLLDSIGPVPSVGPGQWTACGHCANPTVIAGNDHYSACAVDSDCGGALGNCVLPDDAQTCWNSAEATFVCPAQSSVLEYKVTDANHYQLFLPLEYFNSSVPNQLSIIRGMVSTTHYSPVSYCGENGLQLVRPAPGKCGNGIWDAGEQCDPPGSSNRVQFACPAHQVAYETCNAACRYDAPVCRVDADCGNGRIEAGEECDDGNLNGSYGHCSRTCGPAEPQNDVAHRNAGFCGDGIRNYDDKNRDGDKDVGEGFVEYCEKTDAKFVGRGYCSKKPSQLCGTWNGDQGVASRECNATEGICVSANDSSYDLKKQGLLMDGNMGDLSCSATCQSAGGYCGDGILQISDEECDDGNTTNLDACNEYCRVENMACINTIAPQKIQEQGNNTIISITYNNNVAAQCVSTNGNQICAGMGLACLDVEAKNNGVFSSFGRDACESQLTKDINKDIKIECLGHKPGFAAAAVAGSCGNSIVDPGEACDTGAANGQMCDPEYERSCTYCSGDCHEVLTRDAVDICGNGKIDVDTRLPLVNGAPQPEACDIDPRTNQVLIPGAAVAPNPALTKDAYRVLFNIRQTQAICSDKGVYKCENNCRALVSTCVSCGYFENQGKAIPKISVLNVLTPRDPSDMGQANNINTDWGRSTSRNLLRLDSSDHPVNPSGLLALGGSLGWAGSGDVPSVHENLGVAVGNPGRWRQYNKTFNTSDYNELWWLLSSRHNFPLDQGYGWKTSDQEAGPWSREVTEVVAGIETSPLCTDEYALYFNLDSITEALGGDRMNRGATLHPAGAKRGYEQKGSFFPYPVNGEAREVKNAMVLSPAVPQGTFRVVVKWKHLADGPDVNFIPIIYNSAFLNDQQQYRSGMADIVHALSSRGAADPFSVCSQMAQRAGSTYWFPDACNSFKAFGAGGNNDGSVFVHAPGTINTISEVASTVVTGGFRGNPATGHYNSPYAIFVGMISGNNIVPISSFENLDVTVEVYEYHEGQIPESSLYLPTHVYSLQRAMPSSNEGFAQYWHVFNLMKDERTQKYQVNQIREEGMQTQYPHGAIDTSFADVLCRVPGEGCSRG